MTDADPACTPTSKIIEAAREALYEPLWILQDLVVWLPRGEMTGEICSFDAELADNIASRCSILRPSRYTAAKSWRGKAALQHDSSKRASPARIVQAMSLLSADPALSGVKPCPEPKQLPSAGSMTQVHSSFGRARGSCFLRGLVSDRPEFKRHLGFGVARQTR